MRDVRPVDYHSTHLEYLSIQDYKALRENPHITLQLVNSYRTIFGEPDLWAEQYSTEEVMHKLRDELSGAASLRLCFDRNCEDTLAGFCWAQVLDAAQIETSIRTIRYFQTSGMPALQSDLTRVMKNAKVIYLHELAIHRAYRGRLPLNRLILPMLGDLSARSGIREVLFWTIPETRVSRLAQRGGIKMALTTNGMQFFIGEPAGMASERTMRETASLFNMSPSRPA